MSYANFDTTKIGKKGVVVIPAKLRERFGLTEGSLIIAEETSEGILLRPAAITSVEIYSKERRAEFLLSNAVDETDYAEARTEVEAMGLNPESINHAKPVVR